MSLGRAERLQSMYECFQSVGVHCLIRQQEGYQVIGCGDDLGYFLYSTIFSYYLNLNPLVGANVLFYTITLIGLFGMGICFFSIAKTRTAFFIALVGLVRIYMPLIKLNVVYIAYFFSCLFIPLILLADVKKTKKSMIVISFLGGLICSFSNRIRILSALPAIVFYLIYLAFSDKWGKKVKLVSSLFFIVGYLIPVYHFNYEIQRRNTFLKQNNISLPNRENHVFWHNIYTGFGFLQNKYGMEWKDKCSIRAALVVNPQAKYPFKLYEQTVKNLLFKLCKEKRYFVITTIFAKLGVIFYFFLIYFGWIGVVVSWLYPKPWYIELAFWGALGMGALPGIMTIPVTAYLIGFITCTVLYAMYSVIHALNKIL